MERQPLPWPLFQPSRLHSPTHNLVCQPLPRLFPPRLTNAQPGLPRHAVDRAGLDLKDARGADTVDGAGGERVPLDRQCELCAGKAGIIPAAMHKGASQHSYPEIRDVAYKLHNTRQSMNMCPLLASSAPFVSLSAEHAPIPPTFATLPIPSLSSCTNLMGIS